MSDHAERRPPSNTAHQPPTSHSPPQEHPDSDHEHEHESQSQQRQQQHEKRQRETKIVWLAGAPGTQKARHEQVALLMQRHPWGGVVEMRCVYALAGSPTAGPDRGWETRENRGSGGGEDEDSGQELRRELRERRRVETLRAAVGEACGGSAGGDEVGVGVLDDGASARSGASGKSGKSEGRHWKGVAVLVDGFPSTMSEAGLFERLVGKPDCVVVFTGEAGYLKKTLAKELQAKGKARERAKSFGAGASGSSASAGRRRAATEALTGQGGTVKVCGGVRRSEFRRAGDQAVAEEVAVQEEADGQDLGTESKEVERQLADGWHLPLLEVSSRYTAELGPSLVTEVDVQKGKEALYVDVVRVLQRVHSDAGD